MILTTTLYRHYDDSGTLLYVGVSLSAIARLAQHRSASSWYDSIASVRIEKFQTRQEALDAERNAIVNEKPKHNIIHRPKNDHKIPATSKNVIGAELLYRLANLKPLYSIEDAANFLGLEKTWISSAIKDRKLGYTPMTSPGGVERKFISGWQLLEFIESCGVNPK